MTPFVGELVGTALMVWLGNSAVANVRLARGRGESGGWVLVATGWAMALFVGVAVAAPASGAHLNPAVTLAFWKAGRLPAAEIATYLGGQCAGAALGAFMVWLCWLPHWARTEEPQRILNCFCTSPAVRAPLSNVLCEFAATFALVLGLLLFTSASLRPAAGAAPSAAQMLAAVNLDMGALGALPLAILLWAIGLGLGGPTGFAVNPARDLMPRIMHALLPIPGRGGSDWGYAWVPIVGPLLGGLTAALVAGAMVR